MNAYTHFSSSFFVFQPWQPYVATGQASAFSKWILVAIVIPWLFYICYKNATTLWAFPNLALISFLHVASSVINDLRYGNVSTCSMWEPLIKQLHMSPFRLFVFVLSIFIWSFIHSIDQVLYFLWRTCKQNYIISISQVGNSSTSSTYSCYEVL